MPKLTINDRPIEVAAGTTILEAAAAAGVVVPTLCHHKDLSPVGSCRLCLVEADPLPGQVAACTTAVSDGMAVRSETPALVDSRRMILEMLLAGYDDSGGEAARGGADDPKHEFLRWVRHYDVRRPAARPPRYAVDSDPNPFIRVDLNQCILCTRCVRACAEVQGRFVWGVGYRGAEAKIVAGLDTTMLDARCESCGACAAYCPTGALVDRMSLGRPQPDKRVTTVCGYCGVGCQFDLEVRAGRVIGVASNAAAPVNGMALCVKGRYGYDFIHHPDRLTRPKVREYLLSGRNRKPGGDRGPWVDADWGTALSLIAKKLHEVRNSSGPDAIGVLASAKCTNEENYLMQKFARQAIGTNNVDHCARLCHSSTVAGLAMAFGSGAMSNSMRDVAEHARAMLIIGSNTTEQHPVFGTMIRQAVLHRGTKLVVADPRQIDITEFAALHLRHKPGTDVALVNGLAHVILENGWHDEAFLRERCEGFEEVRECVEKYTPERVEKITGVPAGDLRRAAELLANNRPMAVIWAMGITQHTTGVLNVLALANLQMLLGNLGVPGGGVNPLRGQNNVQGACDVGALPDLLPGYQRVADPAAIATFSAAWQLNRAAAPEALSPRPGLTVTEMIDAAGKPEGAPTRIRALYVLGEDPVLTEPDSNHVRGCLSRAEFVVLQEIFPSETAAYADVLLPGASFAEKSGTFTNTERRIQLVRQAIDPPGQARPDWRITAELARRVLALRGSAPAGAQAGWDYAGPPQIMEEIAALSPHYAGVRHSRLENATLQWPVPALDHPGTPILHVGRFPRGKGKLHVVEHLPPAELPDADFPFLLTTGRVLYHWHGGELTRRAVGLLEACPEPLVEISPPDAAALGIDGGCTVEVASRRGRMRAQAVVTERVAEGVVFGNFHFPGEANVNNLTIAALDPVAKIPEYKVCAVCVRPVKPPAPAPSRTS
ncbi:MAG: formate dehydrogenase subunit alpha [Planctomycetia bacterium]|nr:formate dehydrogenase subunit alpha [Planctomycetia bacterium]